MEKKEKNYYNKALATGVVCFGVSAGLLGLYYGYKLGYGKGFTDSAITSFAALLLWTEESIPDAYKAIVEWIEANPDKMISAEEALHLYHF